MSKLEIIDDPKKGILFVLGFIATVPFIEASVKLLGGVMAPPQIALTRFMVHIFVVKYLYIFIYTKGRLDSQTKLAPNSSWYISQSRYNMCLRGFGSVYH